MEARQKRVLPSRTSRGGPGVGNCDVDLMILDTLKRKAENEPLIPVDTPFILTTSLDLLSRSSEASSSSHSLALNTRANDRYFDRPQVLKAYREQQLIETPSFVNISENPSVGGRFRPRAGEENTMDMSDAAYEKRHRKYETFEKRIRLREKEKLKHEQYKLRERIEQLKSTDSSAFLSLADSAFPPPPAPPDIDDNESVASQSANVNGAPAPNEGERRRTLMLGIAQSLEERYRVLLPPERPYKKPGKGSVDNSVEPEQRVAPLRRRASTALESLANGTPEIEKERTLTLKIPPRASAVTTYKSKKKSQETASRSVSPPPKKRRGRSRPETRSPSPLSATLSEPDIAVLDDATGDESGEDEIAAASDSDSDTQTHQTRPKKWGSKKKSTPPTESISAPVPRRVGAPPQPQYASAANVVISNRSSSVLVIAAIRSSNAAVARKGRHLTAFGTKVPEIEHYEYELPAWILEDTSLRRHGADSDSEEEAQNDDMDVDSS